MRHILVIDDDDQLRLMLRQLLEREGYLVSDAQNGEIGLRVLQTQPVDLAIIDIFMPEKEGLETIREIRRIHPLVTIIAVSGGGSTGEMSYLGLARSFGATFSLAKPFQRSDILGIVRKALEDRSEDG